MKLTIKNLHVKVGEQKLLRGLDLSISSQEIHAIMGPNGAGKSTLAKVLAGHPSYEVTEGSVTLDGENLLEMEAPERVHKGLFIGFQYPTEIPGVKTTTFLKTAVNLKRKAEGKPPLSDGEFDRLLREKLDFLEMDSRLIDRNVNEGFSGGEKKRSEILQMALLEPRFAFLDETDSGLDIDAIRIVARGIEKLYHQNMGLVLITHYQRLLDYIKPHRVHAMLDGRIVTSGDEQFAKELETRGYDFLKEGKRSAHVEAR